MLKLVSKERLAGESVKERYLLFDSGCHECAEIADAVEQEAEGWLTVRSLHEEDVKELVSKARPNWKWEPMLVEFNGDSVLVFTGLQMKMRMLIGLGPRRAARIARITRQGDIQGFEMTLAASTQDSPGPYAIESVKRIDRLTALKTLGAFGLAATLLPALPNGVIAREVAGDNSAKAASAVARVRQVKLTPRQALSVFNTVRRQDPNTRKLYAHLQNSKFNLVRTQIQGAVVRTYAADGTAQAASTYINLPHKKANGTSSFFTIRIIGGVANGSGATAGKVKVDYGIFTRTGGFITYAVVSGIVKRVHEIKNLEEFRRRLRNNATAKADSSRAFQSSNCTFCQIIAGTVIGLGCSAYSALVLAVACGVPAGVLCFAYVTALQALFCTTVGFVSVPVACAEIGAC